MGAERLLGVGVGMFLKVWVGFFLLSSFLFPVSNARAARALKFKSDIIPITATAKRAFDLDLRTLLSDPGTGTLTWTIGNDKPAWLTLDSNNHKLFGMPALSDVGLKSFFLNVQDGESGARAKIDLTVQIVPEWSQNPLDLGVQKERQKFTFDLNTKVTNPGPGKLTFSVGSRRGSRRLPAWMTLTPEGILSGTPQRPDVGPYQDIVFVAKTESGGTASVSAFGRVEKDPLPAKWLLNPTIIDNAHEDFPYSFDVSGPTFVSNPEGGSLAFRIVSGAPAWLQMTTSGNLFGTPGKAHVGPVKFRAEVVMLIANRPVLRDETEIQFQVIHTNHRPQWKNDPVVLPDAPSKVPYIQDLVQHVVDIDGDPLTFKVVPGTGPTWAQVSNQGSFTGTPQNANIGMNQWLVEVSDGEFTAQVTVRVKVTNKPPFWLTKPTVLPNAKEGSQYVQDLSKLAKDPENDPISFTLLSGPSWISVTPAGVLSGIPFAEHVGPNTAKVRVSDGLGGSDETDVNIRVDDVNFAPIIKPGITFTLKEREVLNDNLNQAKYVEDPDKDKLTFSLLDTVPWVLLAADGVLTLKPLHANVGTHTVRFRVTDGALNTDGSMKIIVNPDPRPPVWLENPIRFTTKARELFSTNIANKVQDPEGLPVTFSKKSGPAWLTVSASGQLSGTPQDSDIGEGTFVVTARNNALGADANIIITVVNNNHAPFWIQDPLTLARGTAGVAYQDTVAPFARDVDPGDTLTFNKESGPAWASVQPNGAVTGTPGNGDIGLNSLRVKVTDSGGLSATVAVNITVDKGNGAPFWLQSPIVLPDATQDQPFSFNLAPLAKDPDNDMLTFRKVSGPAWMNVAVNGALSGTPRAADLGNYSAVFEVTDGQLSAQVNASGKVLSGNRPPVVNQAALTFTVKERQTLNVNLNQPQYVSDPDGDPLTFQLIDTLAWVSLSSAGQLTLSPQHEHIGDYALRMRVSDGKSATDGILNIKVIKDPKPPIWIVDPVLFEARAKVAFSNTVADKVKDPDNLPLTFIKKSGPAWMSVATNGQLSGTPQESDLGANNFVLTVSNGSASTDGRVIVNVTTSNSPPVVNQQNLTFTVKENQTLTVNLNQPLYVSDPDGDALTFQLIDTAGWVTLTSTGILTLKPLSPQVGDHAFKFNVTDGKSSPVQATLNIKVIKDSKPPIWIEDPIRFTAYVGQLFSVSIADKVKDLNNQPITFTKKSGPAWLNVASSGTLSGTPQSANLGENTFVLTATSSSGSTDGRVIVTVVNGTNKPPIWVQDPITLPNASVGVNYNQTVAPFAMDPDGDALSFSKISGPSWVVVATDGKVFGIPAKTDVGPVTMRVRVTDTKGAFADATVNFSVVDGGANKPPKWVRDPIPFGTQPIGAAFSLDLKPLAFDQDGDPLTFRKVSGPGWIQISSTGMVTGTPQSVDAGEYTGFVSVTDGKSPEVQAAYFGKVGDGGSNRPPKLKPEALSFIVKANEIFQLNINKIQYVEDPDGDPLTFELVVGDSWVTLTPPGDLTLKPLTQHLGDHTYRVRVSDNKGGTDEGPMFVRVINGGAGPVWIQDPIRMTAIVNKPFGNTLADKATDPSGLPLTFSKVSGPVWLNVAGNGVLSGTPPVVGEDTFRVKVQNTANQFAEATLIITVKQDDTPIVDKTEVDKFKAGAIAENLWVIHNSWPWIGFNALVRSLKEDIHVYFEELDKAEVHHTGIYLSTDVYGYNADPIQGNDSSPFISWTDRNIVAHFISRIDATYSKKCRTSPLWSMFKFYEKAPSLSSIYHNGYFTEGMPMDALIITKHVDYFQTYAKGTAQANWRPDDYATNFIQFHEREKQNYRISAIAPDCQAMLDPYEEDIKQTSADNPYRTLVKRTKGQYFSYDCHFDVERVLKDYAKQVIFRARVGANRKIPLSQQPSNPATIEVFVAGKKLTGDLWSYDSAKNEVTIFWEKMDLSQLKPGDLIEVKYRV